MLQTLAEANSLCKLEIWNSDGFRLGNRVLKITSPFWVILILISVFAILIGRRIILPDQVPSLVL